MSVPSYRRRPGRPSGDDPLAAVSTRDLILTVTSRLFTQHSYGGVSLGDIAAAAGLTKASLYYHFRGKEDLFAEAMIAMVKDLTERAAGIYATPASYRARLVALANQMVVVVADSRSIDVLLREAAPHLPPERWRTIRQVQLSGTAKFQQFLQAAMDDGALRPGDASLLAYSFMSLMRGAGVTDANGDFVIAPTAETAERLVDLFLQGTAAGTG